MIQATRLIVLLLVPACWIGWPAGPACSADFFPALNWLAEEANAIRPASGLAEAPLPLERARGDATGYPATEFPGEQAFRVPQDTMISADVPRGAEMRFEQTPNPPIPGASSIGMEPIWDESGWLPVRPGLFARQPLGRYFDAPYGLPPGRHRGVGRPLIAQSWMYRPFSAGWFIGSMFGSPLIDDWLGITSGYFTGFRFGWDHSHYWGLDMQFAYGELGLWDSSLAKEDRRQWYIDHGWPNDRSLDRLIDSPRELELYQWTISAIYYPWGDSRWRPYFSFGIGAARMTFSDIFEESYDKTFFVFPLAFGVKYHWNDWLALRVECSDSFSVPGGGRLLAVHNLSINGALEIRFGGTRTAYWPWNPSRSYW